MKQLPRYAGQLLGGIKMSGTDCTDICDIVISIMCKQCPNYEKCQNIEDEANHEQMEACLINGVLSNPSDGIHAFWPTKFEPMEFDDDEQE